MSLNTTGVKASSTWGPIFIGTVLNLCLLGVVFTQTFNYFTVQKRDHVALKIFIAMLLILGVLHAVISAMSVYDAVVSNYAQVDSLVKSRWTSTATPIINGIVALMYQFFFAWRTKILLDGWILPMAIASLAVLQLVGAIGSTLFMIHNATTWFQVRGINVMFLLWLSATAVACTLISGAMLRYIGSVVDPNVLSKVLPLQRISLRSIHTGVFAALLTILELITYVIPSTPTSDRTSLHLLFAFILPNLYIATLMTALESRTLWRFSVESRSDPPLAPNAHVNTFNGRESLFAPRRQNPATMFEAVNVRTSIHVTRDVESNVQGSDMKEEHVLFPDVDAGSPRTASLEKLSMADAN